MASGLVKSIGDVTKNALATFVGLLTTAVLAACAIAPAAVQAEEMASQDFLNYIEWEIFREDPFTTDHLEEFKTGHWSWNITPIIYDYSRHLESGGTLAEVIEKSFPLLVELTRHRESDGPMTERAYRGNRYHLDPDDTDFKRVFKRYYKENLLMLFSRYRLVIYLYTKRGDTSETVEAYLFFDSL